MKSEKRSKAVQRGVNGGCSSRGEQVVTYCPLVVVGRASSAPSVVPFLVARNFSILRCSRGADEGEGVGAGAREGASDGASEGWLWYVWLRC